MLLLAISTSGSLQSVCLSDANGELACDEQLVVRNAAERPSLIKQIHNVLLQSERQLRDVEVFACDVGPGSFTSLRQGLASLRALAWSLQVPIIPVGSLESMLRQMRDRGAKLPYAVALRARQGVYFVGQSALDPEITEQIVAESEAATHAALGNLAWLGGALAEESSAIAQIAQARNTLTLRGKMAGIAPHARTVAALAREQGVAAAVPALQLLPRYLAASEAEVHAGYAVDEQPIAAVSRC